MGKFGWRGAPSAAQIIGDKLTGAHLEGVVELVRRSGLASSSPAFAQATLEVRE